MDIKDEMERFFKENTYGFNFTKQSDYERTKKVRKIISGLSEDEKMEIILEYMDWELKELKNKETDVIREKKIELLEKQIEDILDGNYDMYEEIRKIKEYSSIEYSEQDILSMKILNMYYTLYRNNRDLLYDHQDDRILEIYNNEIAKEKQYKKYKLIEINEDRKLCTVGNPSYIYDKKIDYTMAIKNVPNQLVRELEKLYEEKKIGNLSFKVSNSQIYKGKRYSIFEELDYGKVFDINNLEKNLISRLYDKKYNDCLLVNIGESEDGQRSVIFEEMYEDKIVCDCKIITQVVHLEYEKQNDKYYVTHFDHEFIYYTEEEYRERIKNPKKRGKKIKSFKADECCIPIDYIIKIKTLTDTDEMVSIEYSFFYYILFSYFKHKNLLKEYFSKMNLS